MCTVRSKELNKKKSISSSIWCELIPSVTDTYLFKYVIEKAKVKFVYFPYWLTIFIYILFSFYFNWCSFMSYRLDSTIYSVNNTCINIKIHGIFKFGIVFYFLSRTKKFHTFDLMACFICVRGCTPMFLISVWLYINICNRLRAY